MRTRHIYIVIEVNHACASLSDSERVPLLLLELGRGRELGLASHRRLVGLHACRQLLLGLDLASQPPLVVGALLGTLLVLDCSRDEENANECGCIRAGRYGLMRRVEKNHFPAF